MRMYKFGMNNFSNNLKNYFILFYDYIISFLINKISFIYLYYKKYI